MIKIISIKKNIKKMNCYLKEKIKNLTLLQYRYNNKIEENYNFVFSTVKIEYFYFIVHERYADVTWPRPQ